MSLTESQIIALNNHFLIACENANIAVAQSMIEKGAQPDAANSVGETALHLAVKSGNLWMVNFVTEELMGNTEARDHFGRTPLHWAAQMGNIFMVEALLLAGADITAADEAGITVRSYAERSGHRDVLKLLSIVSKARR